MERGQENIKEIWLRKQVPSGLQSPVPAHPIHMSPRGQGRRNGVGHTDLHSNWPFLAPALSLTTEKPHDVVGPQRSNFKFSHATEEGLLDLDSFFIYKMGLMVSRPHIAPRTKWSTVVG